jgi:hypothetical protein
VISCKLSGRPGIEQYSGNPLVRGLLICLLAVCSSCATPEKTSLDKSDNIIVLLNPELEPGEDWEHRRLRRGDTTYTRVNSTLGYTIQATGNNSASILFRLFEPIGLDCNRLRWSWLVSNPQPGADLHIKGRDDVAASVFILFGDPGMFLDKPAPAIKYVWANEKHRTGEIIVGPYQQKYVRTRVVRTTSHANQGLVIDQANLEGDYLKAFGEAPANGIFGIALFTDNDDTEEPIVAHYGRIELFCIGV